MSMQNNDTIKSGDIYCGQERKTGKYFAYQIIDVKKEIMTYLLLDYFDEKFPDEKSEWLLFLVCQQTGLQMQSYFFAFFYL